MRIGNRNFNVPGRTYVMGILNVTPDSFSDGGKYYTCEDALKRCDSMIAEGADIIDIGGESSRPGYTPVGFEEQIERIVPVIEKIRENFDIPVSVDTTLPEVARAVIDAGADMINDISGLSESSDEDFGNAMTIAKVAVEHTAKVFRELPKAAASTVGTGQKTVRRQMFLDKLPPEFERKEFVEIAASLGIPLKTAERNIKQWCDKGLLVHLDQGKYAKK